MLLQPATPFVYEVVEPTTAQTTVVDVVVGAVAVAGAVAGFALLFRVGAWRPDDRDAPDARREPRSRGACAWVSAEARSLRRRNGVDSW